MNKRNEYMERFGLSMLQKLRYPHLEEVPQEDNTKQLEEKVAEIILRNLTTSDKYGTTIGRAPEEIVSYLKGIYAR